MLKFSNQIIKHHLNHLKEEDWSKDSLKKEYQKKQEIRIK